MIGAYQLEELFIDRVPVRHFDYIIMEVPGDDDYKMRYHIEYYKDSQVHYVQVKNSNIVKLLKPKEPEIMGFIAKVNGKEISCIKIDRLQIGQGVDYSEFMDVVPDYQSMRKYMTEEPRILRDEYDPAFLSNMETLLFTKLYIFIFSSYLTDVDFKEWKDFYKKHDLLRAMLFDFLKISFWKNEEEGKCHSIIAHGVLTRTCAVCLKKSHKKCSNCFFRSYCDKKCQAKDWPEHKKDCQKVDGAFRRLVARKEPIRVQAYFEEFYKKPVVDFITLKKNIFHKLTDDYHEQDQFRKWISEASTIPT